MRRDRVVSAPKQHEVAAKATVVADVLCKISAQAQYLSTPALIMRRDRVVSAPKQQAAVALVEAALDSVVPNALCKISAAQPESLLRQP